MGAYAYILGPEFNFTWCSSVVVYLVNFEMEYFFVAWYTLIPLVWMDILLSPTP